MKFTHAIAASLTVTAALLMTACAPVSPNLDAHFGESVSVLRAQQTLNAGPPSTEQPKLDGIASHEAMGRYEASYRTPPAQPSFTIGISGAAR